MSCDLLDTLWRYAGRTAPGTLAARQHAAWQRKGRSGNSGRSRRQRSQTANGLRDQLASAPITRQLLVAVATTLPTALRISALANATRRPGLTTVPMARSAPLSFVTGRV